VSGVEKSHITSPGKETKHHEKEVGSGGWVGQAVKTNKSGNVVRSWEELSTAQGTSLTEVVNLTARGKIDGR